MIFAVDFDGTIVQDASPGIGEEMEGAVITLRALKRATHCFILNTCRVDVRGGKPYLRAATEWLMVNSCPPDAVGYTPGSFDNFGGFPGWAAVWRAYLPGDPPWLPGTENGG